MAIPSFQDFMLPMLELMRDGEPHKMLDIKEKLAEYFDQVHKCV
jgi:restriction system protein